MEARACWMNIKQKQADCSGAGLNGYPACGQVRYRQRRDYPAASTSRRGGGEPSHGVYRSYSVTRALLLLFIASPQWSIASQPVTSLPDGLHRLTLFGCSWPRTHRFSQPCLDVFLPSAYSYLSVVFCVPPGLGSHPFRESLASGVVPPNLIVKSPPQD